MPPARSDRSPTRADAATDGDFQSDPFPDFPRLAAVRRLPRRRWPAARHRRHARRRQGRLPLDGTSRTAGARSSARPDAADRGHALPAAERRASAPRPSRPRRRRAGAALGAGRRPRSSRRRRSATFRIERARQRALAAAPRCRRSRSTRRCATFWKDNGFNLAQDRARGRRDRDRLGREPRQAAAGLHPQLDRQACSTRAYSTGELDKFRTRVERTPTGSDIFITHRGMEEIYIGERKEQTVWQPRPADPSARGRIPRPPDGQARRQGQRQAQATVAAATAAPPPRRRAPALIDGRPTPTLQVDDGFDRAWRRVGLALDRSGFTVEDRDRAQGVYFVRYVDPAFAGREEPNFFAKLFSFGKKDDTAAWPSTASRSTPKARTSTVAVLDSTGQARERRSRQAHRRPAPRRPEVSRPRRARHERRVIRFCSLGSGSSGNATVVEAIERHHDDAAAGRLRLLAARARHAAGARRPRRPATSTPSSSPTSMATTSAARWRSPSASDLPLWMSRGTWRAIGGAALPAALRFARDAEPIAVGDLELHPFTVAHDAAEPLQLRCSDGGARLGVLTDLGSITAHMLDNVAGCDALVLECNHDAAMLAELALSAVAQGAHRRPLRPPQQRHRGRDPRRAAPAPGLRHVVAAHLSRENNRPDAGARRAGGLLGGERARRSSSPTRCWASTGCGSAEELGRPAIDRPCKRPPEGGFRGLARARITSRRRSRPSSPPRGGRRSGVAADEAAIIGDVAAGRWRRQAAGASPRPARSSSWRGRSSLPSCCRRRRKRRRRA